MSDCDIVTELDPVFFLHAMENAVVLNIRIVADPNPVDVAAENSVHPDARVLTDDHIPDELGGVVNVAGVGKLRSGAFVGADHRLSDAESTILDSMFSDRFFRDTRAALRDKDHCSAAVRIVFTLEQISVHEYFQDDNSNLIVLLFSYRRSSATNRPPDRAGWGGGVSYAAILGKIK
jgi:hypothetical protein